MRGVGQVSGLHDLFDGETGCGGRKASGVGDWHRHRNGAMAANAAVPV